MLALERTLKYDTIQDAILTCARKPKQHLVSYRIVVSRTLAAAVFNFRHGRLLRLLPVSRVPMATATTTTSAAGGGGGCARVRLVRVRGETARRRRRGLRAALVGADGRRRLGVDVGVAARDRRSTERDMDGATRPDPVRRPASAAAAASARPHGVLPARVGVERDLSGRGALGEVPRPGRRRRRVSERATESSDVDALIISATGHLPGPNTVTPRHRNRPPTPCRGPLGQLFRVAFSHLPEIFVIFFLSSFVAFGALTLLVRRQEEHPACKTN